MNIYEALFGLVMVIVSFIVGCYVGWIGLRRRLSFQIRNSRDCEVTIRPRANFYYQIIQLVRGLQSPDGGSARSAFESVKGAFFETEPTSVIPSPPDFSEWVRVLLERADHQIKARDRLTHLENLHNGLVHMIDSGRHAFATWAEFPHNPVTLAYELLSAMKEELTLGGWQLSDIGLDEAKLQRMLGTIVRLTALFGKAVARKDSEKMAEISNAAKLLGQASGCDYERLILSVIGQDNRAEKTEVSNPVTQSSATG